MARPVRVVFVTVRPVDRSPSALTAHLTLHLTAARLGQRHAAPVAVAALPPAARARQRAPERARVPEGPAGCAGLGWALWGALTPNLGAAQSSAVRRGRGSS